MIIWQEQICCQDFGNAFCITESESSAWPRSSVVKVREKLGSDSEELSDEPYFRNNVALCYPSDAALADHAHRFDALESSPSTLKGAVALGQPGPLFDVSMILFDDIVEIFALPQTNSAGRVPSAFKASTAAG